MKIHQKPWFDYALSVVAVGAAIAAVLLLSRATSSFHKKMIGQPAPDLHFTLASGESASLKGYLGKPVLINFWAHWCAPCLKEMGTLQNLEERFSSRLQLLTIHVEKVSESLRTNLTTQTRFPKNLIFDVSDDDLKAYRTTAIPLSFLIDKEGILRRVYQGYHDWTDPKIISEIEDFLN